VVASERRPGRPERNLVSLLARASADPQLHDRTAVSSQEETRSFGELLSRSRRLAAGLLEHGLHPGDRVAILLPNRIEWVDLLFGLGSMGAVCVPVNILLRASEVSHVCADSGSRWLVGDADSLAKLKELPPCVEQVVLVGEGSAEGALRYEELLGAEEFRGRGPEPEDLAIVYYSSGTTGKPKGAAITHSGVLWNALSQVIDMRLRPEDSYLVVPSLSWAAGFNNVFLPLLWLGGRVILLPSHETKVDRIVANFESTGATHAMLVPTLIKQLLDRPDLLERLGASDLRWAMTGAEPIPRSVVERFVSALPGVELVQAYGMSEFPTIATILKPEQTAEHAETAGKPLHHTEIAIRTDEGEIHSQGEGEVLLRSLAVMEGYLDDPEETERVFADGWFASGDRGRIDEEGFLTITGRVKDMIISGGLNVYPPEIEDVLYQLEGVTEACVVGVPDERWGEVPAALIVSEVEEWDVEAVSAHCRSSLASYKCPKHFLFRSEKLPRNLSGKVLKREVGPWVAERLQQGAGREGAGSAD